MLFRAHLDITLLAERCLYFTYYFAFYAMTNKSIEQLDIEIPFHPLMTIHQCARYLAYLSIDKESCYTHFDNVKDIESIVYFATFFQSRFLFKYIYRRGVKNVSQIGRIFKVFVYTGSEKNAATQRLLWFAADFLERRSVQSIIDSVRCEKMAEFSYNSYTDEILKKEVEKQLGMHEYMMETMRYWCAACGKKHVVDRRPHDVSISYTECCGSPCNCVCYTRFRFRTYYRSSGRTIHCKECGMKWYLGKPCCGKDFSRWQRKRYRSIRRDFFQDRISYYCDEQKEQFIEVSSGSHVHVHDKFE